MNKDIKYCLKFKNPYIGTEILLYSLQKEYLLDIEIFWEKNDDEDIRLNVKPIYIKNFSKIIRLISRDEILIKFLNFIILKHVNNVDFLEKCYKLEIKKCVEHGVFPMLNFET